MTQANEVRDVLLKAAKIVSEGWCQHQAVQIELGKTYRCIVGALWAAVGALWAAGLSDDYSEAAARSVSSYLGLNREDLPVWNDTPGRLAIEVEDALRETALSLEES